MHNELCYRELHGINFHNSGDELRMEPLAVSVLRVYPKIVRKETFLSKGALCKRSRISEEHCPVERLSRNASDLSAAPHIIFIHSSK